MPIKVQNDLPAKKIMEKENIFIMNETRAVTQNIRPLQIAILNLMPLKEDTEIQMMRSLSNTPLQLEITFLTTASYIGKNTPASHLNQFYQTFDDVKNKITGLDSGADDYMTKPFVPEELLARIRALSRRQGEVILEELTFDDLTLNLSSNDLSCKNKSIHLGYKEFEILKILMSNPKILISKETLIVKVWGAESAAESNNVEAYISFLRKKFHYLDSKVTIGTVRKVGYRLESEETS